MSETAIDRFWQLLRGALALNPEAFQTIEVLPFGSRVALYVLLLAGLSQAIGQAIVLFVNQVKPIRFILSLLINSILLAVSTAFWILSTWFVAHLIFRDPATLDTVFRTIGLAQAPQILGFFVALPYLGTPISVLLSLWTLLAFIAGFDVVTGLNIWDAFTCSALGWGVVQIFQRTIGRPFVTLQRWLANTAAGVNLVTNLRDIEQVVEGLQVRRRNR